MIGEGLFALRTRRFRASMPKAQARMARESAPGAHDWVAVALDSMRWAQYAQCLIGHWSSFGRHCHGALSVGYRRAAGGAGLDLSGSGVVVRIASTTAIAVLFRVRLGAGQDGTRLR